MTIGNVVMLVTLGGLLVALGAWLTFVFLRHQQPRQTGLERLLTAPNWVLDKEAEEEEVAKEAEAAALPMDPDNPPFPRIYHRRQGRPQQYCHCHDRPLIDGQTILFWPNPDEQGAFWLVCEQESAG